MGLQKTYTSNYGIDGDYWKIITAYDNRKYSSVEVNLALYINKAASDANMAAISYRDYTFSGGNYPFADLSAIQAGGTDQYEVLYDKIKADDAFFSDAIDVLE